jgi:regulator of replication initiation timing
VNATLPPRIPRSEAVGRDSILTRLYDVEAEVERVKADIEANTREYNELAGRNHDLISEHDRLRRKLMFLDEAAP